MEWITDPKIQALVSPSLARSFRVMPLGEEDGCIQLLFGRRLGDAEREAKEALLAFYLGRDVKLHTVDEYPAIESGFDEIIDHYYGVPFPEMLSKPVARHVATILLLDPVADRRMKHADQLAANGCVVLQVPNTEEALRCLQAPGCEITEVLLPPKPWEGEVDARRRLLAVADVKISRIEKALAEYHCDATQV